jgi:hypothetical protein
VRDQRAGSTGGCGLAFHPRPRNRRSTAVLMTKVGAVPVLVPRLRRSHGRPGAQIIFGTDSQPFRGCVRTPFSGGKGAQGLKPNSLSVRYGPTKVVP